MINILKLSLLLYNAKERTNIVGFYGENMWITIISVFITVISLGNLILYRRQIKSFCRQLKFIQNNVTNKRISQDINYKEITELSDCLNDILKKQHQSELEYKKKDKQIKETIMNLSHDIRTPITSLKGYFELLLEAEGENEQERYHKIINSRINSLNDILEQLFTYTKLQNDTYQFVFEECNMNAILYEAVFSFYEEFKSKRIEPAVSIPEDNGIVWANSAAMKRAIQNIIKNALDHGKEQIVIEMFIAEKVEIIVKNKCHSGDSIDADKVFNRFYKADTLGGHQSTGLGLSIAYELIKVMNGTIAAYIEEAYFVIKIELPIIIGSRFL
jgi:signal transduction histidine kinase